MVTNAPRLGIFGAALVVCANEMARPSNTSIAAQSMQNSITILEFCGKSDILADRSASVLRAFLEVIQRRASNSSLTQCLDPSNPYLTPLDQTEMQCSSPEKKSTEQVSKIPRYDHVSGLFRDI